MIRRCVVIEHLAVEHSGTLKPALESAGYEVSPLPAASLKASRRKAEDADLLIVMGGPIGVYDAPEYPFLDGEMAIIRERLAAGRAVLGICLGSQLMAAALGARVYPGTAGFELGWASVSLTEHGRRHPLARVAGNDAAVLHWHGDTFDLPVGATLLASTSRYPNQAFAVGNHGLALQFHVETDEAELEQWFVAFAGDIKRMGPDTLATLRADTAGHARGLADRNKQFILEWVASL